MCIRDRYQRRVHGIIMNSSYYPIILGKALNRIVQSMENALYQGSDGSQYTKRFESIEAPRVSIAEYLIHFTLYAECSDACLIFSFIYIDKLLHNVPGFWLNQRNIHRVLLISIVLAIKYLDDIYADNFVYAKIGGIPLDEFNYLEKELLALLNFDLYVSPQLYFCYLRELLIHYEKILVEEYQWTRNCQSIFYNPVNAVGLSIGLPGVTVMNE
eukprot:TRINITY_DN8988_c0_g1_i2.p1 TRINITY_DN8988_c0_g1~~TRINITY_DN8988_c0_g1_i2.p1  ORF type:complete len:214 (-),score=26.57 TRINITY_DN8988_c0_g1_i2:265-906(-)